MYEAQQRRLNQLQEEAESLEDTRAQIFSAIGDAISKGESFATILGLVTEYGIADFQLGYTKAEIVHTKYPVRYDQNP